MFMLQIYEEKYPKPHIFKGHCCELVHRNVSVNTLVTRSSCCQVTMHYDILCIHITHCNLQQQTLIIQHQWMVRASGCTNILTSTPGA